MKKEIIKPFDLASYKNGAKVKTRDGHEVRIICTDAKHIFYPIIALVKLTNDNESTMNYTLEGKKYCGLTDKNDTDLVIVEEVEEPEFWSDDKNNTLSGFYVTGFARISEMPKTINIKCNYNVFATEKQAKSARAMARISQIMANDIENFGGAITDEEWEDHTAKYAIFRNGNNISPMVAYYEYFFLAFHTKEQRNLFLEKYPDLVKEYLMVD